MEWGLILGLYVMYLCDYLIVYIVTFRFSTTCPGARPRKVNWVERDLQKGSYKVEIYYFNWYYSNMLGFGALVFSLNIDFCF